MCQDEAIRWDKAVVRESGMDMHTLLIFNMDNQQGLTVWYKELCSMLSGSLGRRRIWERMGTVLCMAESLCCPPETITWLISYAAAAAAAAAAKLLQSCPTLCDPTDGSPPGSPVPGILQARTLEWAATSFSNA